MLETIVDAFRPGTVAEPFLCAMGEARATCHWELLDPRRYEELFALPREHAPGQPRWRLPPAGVVEAARAVAGRLRGDAAFAELAGSIERWTRHLPGCGPEERMVAYLLSDWQLWGHRPRMPPAGPGGDPVPGTEKETLVVLALQRAVEVEFCLERWADGSYRRAEAWAGPEGAAAVYESHAAALRAFVQALYCHTQADLAARGIDRLMLWRGHHFGRDHFGLNDYIAGPRHAARGSGFAEVAPRLQPASSFSPAFRSAVHFASRYGPPGAGGELLLAEVPASRVLGTARAGLGGLDVGEVVVLAGPGTAWSLVWGPGERPPGLPAVDDLGLLAARYGYLALAEGYRRGATRRRTLSYG